MDTHYLLHNLTTANEVFYLYLIFLVIFSFKMQFLIYNLIFVLLIADQIMNNSMDFDLQDIIENRSRDSIGENGKDELMETQTYENHSYSDIALEDTVEKQLNDL